MSEHENTFVYLALFDERRSPGVASKAKGIVDAARSLGYTSRLWRHPKSDLRGHYLLLRAAATAPESYLMIRNQSYVALPCMIVFAIARLRGKSVIIEVPTPFQAGIQEVLHANQPAWRRLAKAFAFFSAGPWSFWPASRVVQYAEEGGWFMLGNRRRTMKIGNGIAVQAIPVRRSAPPWPAEELRLIGVAQVKFWHGYDRVLRAMATFRQDPRRQFAVRFTIVGDGSAIPELKALSSRLGLDDWVKFAGLRQTDELFSYYASAHLAVGSLGLHRVGLKEASVLKAREYCAVGIPFIASGSDPDFDGSESFRFCVAQSEDETEIVELFAALGQSTLPPPEQMRAFAELHLDHTIKLRRILDMRSGGG